MMARNLKKKRPPVVAVTGGIGSGKSTVVEEFARLGAEVVEADTIGREMVTPYSPAWKRIVRKFGKEITSGKGEIDRGKLAAIVFIDRRKRRILEGILHPRIICRIRQKVRELRARENVPLIVLDIPLLYEVGMQGIADKTIVVWVSRAVQIQRIRSRDRLSLKEINARLAAQLPLRQKRTWADYVIDNTRSRGLVREQVRKLWGVLTKTF